MSSVENHNIPYRPLAISNPGYMSSAQSHNQCPTNPITDLAGTLATHKGTNQLPKNTDEAIKQVHADRNYPSCQFEGGITIRISNTKIQRVEGDFASDNKVYCTKSSIAQEMNGNEIGFIGGDLFSGNAISPLAP
ncbi:hypothetical protein AX14_000996 [Amanita brunnescens Koide BX004]|nr:hypothetical protein AX14_000996 [Amanita brunnescens Koide BX004]